MINSNYLIKFSLAFIEELLQDGITFIDKKSENLVRNEYPHYCAEYSHEMKRLYRLWINNSEKLSKYREALLLRLDRELSNRIVNDKYFRFMILKTFHDSIIDELVFDNENKTLKLIIDYDDCFSKTQFGKQFEIVFYGIANCSDCLYEIIDFVEDSSVLIQNLEQSVINDKVKFKFDLVYFGSIEGKFWQLDFLCDKMDISGKTNCD